MLQLAVAADRERVNELARQVHEIHVSWRPDIFCIQEELFPESVFRELIGARSLYVAKMDGLIVGYALVHIRKAEAPGSVARKIMEMEQICVDTALQRQGIGTEIMTDLHALARAFGCTDLQLTVYPQNDAAIAFYEKCGFTIRYIGMQRKV